MVAGSNPAVPTNFLIQTNQLEIYVFECLFHHLNGSGCPASGYARKASRFIGKAREIHGNKYDYSETLYKGMKSRLSVICPKHGCFDQSAQGHLSGLGCPWCAGKNVI